MGILQLIPQKSFFVKPEEPFSPGQFCWVPVPHIDPIPRILDIERDSPEEHTEVSFKLRNANKKKDFRVKDRVLPIKYLNLRAHEELLVQRAKKRPAIILSTNVECFPDIAKILKTKGKKHLQEDAMFVVPCYSIEKGNSRAGFPAEMVTRIRCLIYRQFFYYPASTELHEGVARFDRVQTVIGKDPATIEPVNLALSDEAYSVFLSVFLYCMSGDKDDDLESTKELLAELI